MDIPSTASSTYSHHERNYSCRIRLRTFDDLYYFGIPLPYVWGGDILFLLGFGRRNLFPLFGIPRPLEDPVGDAEYILLPFLHLPFSAEEGG